jgi:hypothetical protein
MSDCCNIDERAKSCGTALTEKRVTTQCIECGTEGRSVERRTVLHHVKHEHLDRGNGEAYRFCSEHDCKVVYYGDRGTQFTVNDIRELVSAKTTGDPRPICYCFGFTEGDARKQIELSGSSTISATVSRFIRFGMCACEVRNPAGVCCLSEINRTVKHLSSHQAVPAERERGAVSDCCAGEQRS